MASEGKKFFRYDAPSPSTCRLFLLELNGEQDPLQGRLMTFQFYQAVTNLKAMAKAALFLFKDTEDVMEAVSQSRGYTALSYSWGQSPERHPLWVSTISCEFDRSMRKSRFDFDSDSKKVLQDH